MKVFHIERDWKTVETMKGERRTTYEILRVSEGSIGMKTPERAVVLDSSFVCFALPLCLSALL